MKKLVFALACVCSSLGIWAQCTQACGIYSLNSGFTYSIYPNNGTPLPLGDDDTSAFIPLGFNFDFYCATYNKVKVCSNGFITFDNTQFSPAGTPYAQSLPSSSSPNAVIAYNWNDLDPSAGGSISYITIGTSPNKQFIVTYTNIPIWSFGGNNSGQIVLNEVDGSIEIHTGSAINNGWLTHTQGIENLTGSVASPVSGRNLSLWTATSTAVRWDKAIIGTPPTGITGNTSTCYGLTELYTCNNMPGAISYSWSLPNGWQGSSISTAINATTAATGILSVSAIYTCGYSSAATITVTVNPPPVVAITSAAPPVICSGNIVTITTTGSQVYTLEPGSITGTSPFTVMPLSTTNYSVYGISSFSCMTIYPPTSQIVVNQTPILSINSGTICLGQTFTMTPSGANTYVFSTTFPEVTPLTVGTFTYGVVGTALNGCSSVVASTVVVNPIPSLTLSANRTSICAKESTSLSLGGATSYTWSNSTSSLSTIVVSPTLNTNYTVTGANSFGCKRTATITIQVNACVGVQEMNGDIALAKVFPNPSNGLYTLLLEQGFLNTNLELFSSSGQLLFKQILVSGNQTLDLKTYPNGLYYLKLVGEQSTQVFKLLKE